MNQILFEMYIGVITNFQKEPDYEYQISYDKVFSRICFNSTAIGSLHPKINIYIDIAYPDEEGTTEIHPVMTTMAIRQKRVHWSLSVLP